MVYVSPLKALSNDIQINLQNPLAGITEHLRNLGLPPLAIRTAVRTGDTRKRPRTDAQAPAAYPGDHPGIALRAAGLGLRPTDARQHAHGDHR